MKTKKLAKEHAFNIWKIRTNSFFQKQISDSAIDTFDDNKLALNFIPTFDYDVDENLVILNIQVIFEYEQQEILNIDTDIIFKFPCLDDYLTSTGEYDAEILEILLELAFSTLRGIIFSKTEGSFINKYYLPIINPEEIILDKE